MDAKTRFSLFQKESKYHDIAPVEYISLYLRPRFNAESTMSEMKVSSVRVLKLPLKAVLRWYLFCLFFLYASLN